MTFTALIPYPPASFRILRTCGLSRDFSVFPQVEHRVFPTRPDPAVASVSKNTPARTSASRRERAWTWIAVLVQAATVLIALDALASNIGPSVVDESYSHLASARASQWMAAVNSGLTLQSKDLAIHVSGDKLTATYTVTAPAGSLLGARAEADDDSNAGNDLVHNVLGDVTVAEFRYGFTGSQYTPEYLSFQPPTLTISTTTASPKQVIDTVTVQSYPFRLYRQRQQLAVLAPDVADDKPLVQIHVTAPGTSVSDLASLTMRDAAGGSGSTLAPSRDYDGSSTLTFALSEEGSGQSWLDGLRGVGGITIPFVDPLLSRLNSLFVFALLWWVWCRPAPTGGARDRRRRDRRGR